MMLARPVSIAFAVLLTLVAAMSRAAGTDAPSLYAEHCASCHGAGRLGGIGPALLPENLGRLKRDEAIATIRDGRVASQMPGFRDKLSTEQITQLAGLIYEPLAQVPRWDMADIRGSHVAPVK
ncbi:MAG: cytochrome c, partial [Gammaproteobacteria bacterium]|nr:cytochrome c [Gammaproteobacteria bacterium]